MFIFLSQNDIYHQIGKDIHPDFINQKSCIEMGYVIHKKYWNQGYATELAYALIDWGINKLKIEKIIALTRLDNKKSQHILAKVGMQYVKETKSEEEDFLLYEIYK